MQASAEKIWEFAQQLLCYMSSAATFYPLSLHDALPISSRCGSPAPRARRISGPAWSANPSCSRDRKSTRLNSSHVEISYAVFCLKKKILLAQNNFGVKTGEQGSEKGLLRS